MNDSNYRLRFGSSKEDFSHFNNLAGQVKPMTTRNIILVTGQTGCGKSTWVRQYLSGQSRVLGIDPTLSLAEPHEVLHSEDLIERYDSDSRILDSNNFRYYSTVPEDAELFASVGFVVGHCAIVIDEAVLVFPSPQAPLPAWCRDVVFLGRHRGVSLIITAQRAASIPIAIRSQANRVVTFRQTEPNDVRALWSIVGDEARNLPVYPNFQCLDFETGGKRKIYKL